MNSAKNSVDSSSRRWLNGTVLGVGVTSLFSDWSHELATAVLPAFLTTIGAGPAWLGAIEGIADGLSSFTKLGAGYYTDRWKRRKPVALFGYAVTAVGTASFAFATHAYQVLFGRSAAWLGRGVRSPAKKALLAADVSPAAYGRAFGLERLLDTVGAIAGPLTALWLLEITHNSYRTVLLWTLLPGMIAVASFWLLVRERPIEGRKKQSLRASLRDLPSTYRHFLLAVGIFGCGDYSHTLLIFLASRLLTPAHGTARAAILAVGLYTLHNVFSAGSSYVSGWISDHVSHRKYILGAGYALAGVTAIFLMSAPTSFSLLAFIFILAGLYVGTEAALEDSVAADLLPNEQHGMAFGTLAAINAIGDVISSLLVGFLWSAVSLKAAFALPAALSFIGSFLVLRLREKSHTVSLKISN